MIIMFDIYYTAYKISDDVEHMKLLLLMMISNDCYTLNNCYNILWKRTIYGCNDLQLVILGNIFIYTYLYPMIDDIIVVVLEQCTMIHFMI